MVEVCKSSDLGDDRRVFANVGGMGRYSMHYAITMHTLVQSREPRF